ncbi:MAG: CHASE2 domain-containing protein [Alphaproteobacteria bacterium]|nr:CHASE2 domain-containing protein [Alphaproteobacteria bacterium]
MALICGAWPNGFFETSRNWLFDVDQRLGPAERGQSHVTLINIDADSIQRIGQWPWPRDKLAQLVTAAKAARVIGIDLLLSEPDRLSPENWVRDHPGIAPEIRNALLGLPSTDAILAQGIRDSPVVMAAVAVPKPTPQSTASAIAPPIIEVGRDPRPEMPNYGGVVRPLSAFAAAAHGLGLVTLPPEPDGVMRRIPALMAVGNELVPSFVLEVMRQWTGADSIVARGDAAGLAEVTVGDFVLRTDQQGRVWPRYAAEPPVQAVSAATVLEGRVPASVFRDRIVLIGVSAPGLGDVIVSPLRRPEQGVAVHAQLIESLLAGDFLWRPPLALGGELILALILGVAAMTSLGRVRPGVYAGAFAATLVLLILGAWFSFSRAGLLLDWTFPVSALLVTSIIALTTRVTREIRIRRHREQDLETALLLAEAADRTKTEFLANVSHELRTPLSAIIGFSDVMRTGVLGQLPSRYVGYVTDIHSSGVHLLGIIEEVLDLSVIDLGGARAGHDPVDVEAYLHESARVAAPRAVARNVRIVCDIAVALPILSVSARMFKQMIANLLSNAVKYSPEGGEITLGAFVSDRWLVVSVRDRGRGMAKADLPKALTPFGRLQSARLAQEPGIGLGLSLTKSMLELHGGMLKIESEIDQGTTVALWFPPTRLIEESGT